MKKLLALLTVLTLPLMLGACAAGQPDADETEMAGEEETSAEEGMTAAEEPMADESMSAVTLETAASEEYGTYLVDGDGRALYLFTADAVGESSTCHDDCAEAWPPLVTDGEPSVASGLDASLVGTIPREEGSIQVTYGGWPLYYFQRDSGPGSKEGQDVHGFGGEWYLVSPQGEEVHGEEHAEGEEASTS